MPSFSETQTSIILYSVFNFQSSLFSKQKKIIEALQVPVIFPLNHKVILTPKKGALPFTFRCLPASITLEAALSFPLFLFFAAALFQPSIWLDRQRKIQTETEILCERLSEYEYLSSLGLNDTNALEAKQILNEQLSGEEEMGLNGNANMEWLTGTAASIWLKGRAENHTERVIVHDAKVPDEKGDICLVLSYKEKIPFFSIMDGDIKMQAGAKRRAWTGIEGKLRSASSIGGGGEATDSEEIMVYVGKSMGRYHWFRDCHYISNQYEAVSGQKVRNRRNSDGKRYSPCARCGASDDMDSVYITPGGEHYHAKQSCSAMVSYVRSIPLMEAEHLGACSYCMKRKGENE